MTPIHSLAPTPHPLRRLRTLVIILCGILVSRMAMVQGPTRHGRCDISRSLSSCICVLCLAGAPPTLMVRCGQTL
ncbi:hypothetical protein BDQ17DRAFT_1349978 [Cyathus striatus]|nr:hypothetical protein BDQ17DRAFT_1349978 [Cyathus striatus]